MVSLIGYARLTEANPSGVFPWGGEESPTPVTKTLKVRCFGTFAMGEECRWEFGPPSKRGGEFIQYLVAYPNSVASRAELSEAFWPGVAADMVTHRLHIAASGARKSISELLGGFDAIRCDPAGYAWHPNLRLESDLARFLQLYGTGTPQALRESVHLYAGEFLAGANGDWLQPTRVRCCAIYFDMLERLAQQAYDAGEIAEALQLQLRIVDADRGHEGASRLVMRCFAALGRRSSVVTEYEALRNYLERHLGVEPSTETRLLMRSLIDPA